MWGKSEKDDEAPARKCLHMIAEDFEEGIVELIFHTYSGFVVREVCSRMAQATQDDIRSLDEEDLLQECSLEIYSEVKKKHKEPEGLQGIKSVTKFLERLAYYTVIDTIRKHQGRGREHKLERIKSKEGTGTDIISIQSLDDKNYKKLEQFDEFSHKASLANLDRKEKYLLIKIIFKNKTLSEVAEEEGCDEKIILNRFMKAYNRLKRNKK